jgi:hypothetical protein
MDQEEKLRKLEKLQEILTKIKDKVKLEVEQDMDQEKREKEKEERYLNKIKRQIFSPKPIYHHIPKTKNERITDMVEVKLLQHFKLVEVEISESDNPPTTPNDFFFFVNKNYTEILTGLKRISKETEYHMDMKYDFYYLHYQMPNKDEEEKEKCSSNAKLYKIIYVDDLLKGGKKRKTKKKYPKKSRNSKKRKPRKKGTKRK